MRKCVLIHVLSLTLLGPVQESAAEIRSVRLDIHPYSSARSECSTLGHQTLAGCIAKLWVEFFFDPPQVNPDVVVEGYPASWPDGLLLEASFEPDRGFTEDLMRHFQPQFIPNPKWQIDSLWRADPEAMGNPPAAELNRFDFHIIPPAAVAGRRVFFRATYHSRTFGTVVSAATSRHGATVLAPCSVNDSMALMTSQVNWAASDSESVAVVDSMLAKGWKTGSALSAAIASAERLGQYDRALRYLDSLYTVDDHYARHNVWTSDPANKEREYERMRSRILELKAKQEEQQR